MNGQTRETKEATPSKTVLQRKIPEYLERCIECNRCMEVCPVTKDGFSLHELNVASQEGQPVPPKIREFAFHCMQCGSCVPVCPKDIRRDHLMLSIKHKVKDKKPWGYRRYLLIKGLKKPGVKRFLQNWYIRSKKLSTKDLACYMEQTPVRNSEVLFYPGCYIYSAETIRHTLRLLDHVGCDYTILGGVTFCCGMPHRLQGEFAAADECQKLLAQKIKTCAPKIIITACAECFEAIEQIKKTYQMDVEVLTVAQYLLRFQDKFTSKKIRGKVAVHDSCRLPADSPQGMAAYQSVSRFADLADFHKDQPSRCCSQWNHDSDPQNIVRRMKYLKAVQRNAPTLVCNCLTCYEELEKTYSDVEVIDVLQLFVEALEVATETEEQP